MKRYYKFGVSLDLPGADLETVRAIEVPEEMDGDVERREAFVQVLHDQWIAEHSDSWFEELTKGEFEAAEAEEKAAKEEQEAKLAARRSLRPAV